ncbi:hypothetical protein B0H11DRAFT_2192261 [Mycena galericulata]|nr:hypothetical protein B0H11DRAFT_2192261 [Mycena galericulata]
MPSLPPSPPASPSFTWAQVKFLVIFLVVVLGVSGTYLLALHLADKIAARRARVSDVEKAANATSVMVASKPKAPAANPKAAAAAAVLAAARAQPLVTVKSALAPVAVVSMTPVLVKRRGRCSDPVRPTQVAHSLPGPSPLRAVCHAAEPVSMPVVAPAPVLITVSAATPVAPAEPVNTPPIAVTLAHAIAAAYHSDDEDSASTYSDSEEEEDEDEDPSRFQVVPWIAKSGVPIGAGSRTSLCAVRSTPYALQHHSPGPSRNRILNSSSCNILSPPRARNMHYTPHTKPAAAKECLSPLSSQKTHHHRAVRMEKENGGARIQIPARAFIA